MYADARWIPTGAKLHSGVAGSPGEVRSYVRARTAQFVGIRTLFWNQGATKRVLLREMLERV